MPALVAGIHVFCARSKTWMARTSPANTQTPQSARVTPIPLLPRRRRLALQAPSGIKRGRDDALVAGAAAQIAGDRDAHLLLGWVRIVAQELGQGGQHPGRAEAALQAMVVAERLLQRIELVRTWREPFDRRDGMAVGLHREHQAGARRKIVEQNGAGSAHAVLAAKARARE